MRAAGLVSVVLCIAAIILAFLCLFAGKPGVLDSPNYAIVALNTSRVGESIIRDVRDEFSNDKRKLLDVLNKLLQSAINGNSKKARRHAEPFTPLTLEDILTPRDLASLPNRDIADLEERGIIDAITGTFKTLTDPSAAFAKAEEIIDDLQQKVGLDDFYLLHVRDYCEGQYTPTEVPNATYTLNQIQRNITECKGFLHFKPGDLVQKILDKTKLSEANVTLETIHWPKDLDDKFLSAEKLLNATLWLYVVTIILAFLAMIMSVLLFFQKDRKQAITGIIITVLALLATIIVAVASIITTAAATQVDKIVKSKGDIIGLSNTRGSGFMGLTWACAACMFIVSLLGCFGCCGGMRRKKTTSQKYG